MNNALISRLVCIGLSVSLITGCSNSYGGFKKNIRNNDKIVNSDVNKPSGMSSESDVNEKNKIGAGILFNIGAEGTDYGKDVTTDENGNIYVTGYFQGTVDFDPTDNKKELTAQGAVTGPGNVDTFVAKYNQDGKLQWVNKIGGTGTTQGNMADMPHTVEIDKDGNVYLAGYVSGNVTFGQVTDTMGAGRNLYIAKYDTDGNYIWHKQFGDVEANITSGRDTTFEEVNQLVIDKEGNSYIIGVFNGNIDLGDGKVFTSTEVDTIIASLDKDGNVKFAYTISGEGNETGNAIGVDSKGNIYVSGAFSGNANFGRINSKEYILTNVESATTGDIFLAKYDKEGNFIDAKKYSGTGADQTRPGALAIDKNDNVYIAGDFTSSINFGKSTITSVGMSDTFAAKFDSDLNNIWAIRFGGDSTGIAPDAAHRIEVDNDGNVILAGWVSGKTEDFQSNDTNGDIMINKYDKDGELLWNKHIGEEGRNSNEAMQRNMAAGLEISSKGDIIVVGKFVGNNLDFGNNKVLSSNGKEDIFIVKYNGNGEID